MKMMKKQYDSKDGLVTIYAQGRTNANGEPIMWVTIYWYDTKKSQDFKDCISHNTDKEDMEYLKKQFELRGLVVKTEWTVCS